MHTTKPTLDIAATEAAAAMMDRIEIGYVLHDIRVARELSRRDGQSVHHFNREESIFEAALARLHENPT